MYITFVAGTHQLFFTTNIQKSDKPIEKFFTGNIVHHINFLSHAECGKKILLIVFEQSFE
jgi:hypothetical protein